MRSLGLTETHTHMCSATCTLLMCCTQNASKFGKLSSGHRNAVANQAITARTGHGAMDRFKIGKGVCEGCILSPSSFNFYTERSEVKLTQSSNSLQPHGLSSPWNSPGQNIGMGSCYLLQVIFPTQGSKPGLPQCK